MDDMAPPSTSSLGSSVSDLNIGYLGRPRINNRRGLSFVNRQTTALGDASWAQRSSLNPEMVGGLVKAIDLCVIVGVTAAVWAMTGAILLFAAFFTGAFGINPEAWAPGWIATTFAFLLIERGIVAG